MTQLTLDYSKAEVRRTHAPGLAARMIAYLHASPGWTTRAEFREKLGLTDREVRLGREASHSRIAYGQKGFKLLKALLLEEWNEYDARLAADIKSAQHRRLQAHQRYHSGNLMERIA